MTSHMAGIGDDGLVHWWRWTMGEAMTRLCDDVESTNVEPYARDLHGDRDACVTCGEKRR